MSPLDSEFSYIFHQGSSNPFEEYSNPHKHYEYSFPGYQPSYGGDNYESASDYGRPYAESNYPSPSSAQSQKFVPPADSYQLPFSPHNQGLAPLPPTSPIEIQIPGQVSPPPMSPGIETQIPGQAPSHPISPGIDTQIPGQATPPPMSPGFGTQISSVPSQGTVELGVKSSQIEVPPATPPNAQIEPGPVPPAPPSDAQISNPGEFGASAVQGPLEPVTPPTTLAKPRGMPSIHLE
ncbi:hypothetical protein ANCCAN_11682 [Ancylostoma caninum]|uniref:Uncharacterized protein n=1 Tax=Ancylostoma caninum TaxID=29170 RepID=A0A368GHK1_ANCCA|nr:hypothetical protein ANCCAN_11682 [Ancylostoma caninum]